MIATPVLIAHIAAGAIGILTGVVAISVRKGELVHRAFGRVFVAFMLTMSALGAYLAVQLPQRASIAVGTLTFYLVATAWMTVRRKDGGVGAFEKGALAAVLGVAAALLTFAAQAALSPSGRLEGAPPAPYLVFAAFAAFCAALDIRVILRGGVWGAQRIARHLWRMCFALFFAIAFFSIQMQKIGPGFLHGSPLLVAASLAPLMVMIYWLARIRYRFRPDAVPLSQGKSS